MTSADADPAVEQVENNRYVPSKTFALSVTGISVTLLLFWIACLWWGGDQFIINNRTTIEARLHFTGFIGVIFAALGSTAAVTGEFNPKDKFTPAIKAWGALFRMLASMISFGVLYGLLLLFVTKEASIV